MPTITIKFVNPPKEGKKLATVKDTNDKLHFFDPKKLPLSTFSKGSSYDVDLEESEYNGVQYSHIKKVKTAKTETNGGGGDRWYMPFVSNTVAHAITAGCITEPGMIKMWAAAAKQAAEEIERKAEDTEPPVPDDWSADRE